MKALLGADHHLDASCTLSLNDSHRRYQETHKSGHKTQSQVS